MKKLMIVLAACVVVIGLGFKQVTADQGWTPLEQVAGTYAFTDQGSIAVCLDQQTFALVHCGSAGSIVAPLSILHVGVITYDIEGNSCEKFTETETHLPVNASPPAVFVLHVAGKITNYDPTTGTGDASFTEYVGGQCHGATFDSKNATVAGTGTYHFAVSNRGKRIDAVLTSIVNPANAIGGFSFSSTALRE
jgi:hypothetical protein